MQTITDKWWFTTLYGVTFGIVKTVDNITGEEKFRIGMAAGGDEETDAKLIAKTGAQLFPEMIK